MVLRQPSYKFILVFLSGALITILITFLQNTNSSLGNFLQVVLLYSIFLGVFPSLGLLLLYYWKVNKTIIDENAKVVTLIIYRFHFFKIREYKFSGKGVRLEIVSNLDDAWDGIWELYLCYPSLGERFLILQSFFYFILVRKAKEIQVILNCRIENPYEKKTLPKGCVS